MKYNNILNWWQKQPRNTVDDYKAILDNFQIVFATNNNTIEGVHIDCHTTREVFEQKTLTNYTGSADSLFLVRNQKFAFNAILKSLVNKTPISLDSIQRLHKVLMYGSYDDVRWDKGERPGDFKKHDYCVGIQDIGSLPEDVPADLSDLVDEINSVESSDILLCAAYFHAVFETIHPFADGNGRTGRTLVNYYLMLHDYPPMVIFDEDKETYYMALEVYNRTGKLSGMRKFFEEQTIKTWESKVKPFDDKLQWCRDNAPDALKDVPDSMLLTMMGPSYEQFVKQK